MNSWKSENTPTPGPIFNYPDVRKFCQNVSAMSFVFGGGCGTPVPDCVYYYSSAVRALTLRVSLRSGGGGVFKVETTKKVEERKRATVNSPAGKIFFIHRPPSSNNTAPHTVPHTVPRILARYSYVVVSSVRPY